MDRPPPQLGEGAVGSLLAAVGTAMPETLISIVALLGAKEGADDVAIGAIVGAPFLLATLAMGLVGLFAYLYRENASRACSCGSTGHPGARPDLLPRLLHARPGARLGRAAAAADRGRRPLPARLSALHRAAPCAAAARCRTQETLYPLIFERRSERRTDPGLALCVMQLLVGLGAMVGGAHLFVEELLHIADSLGVEAVVLALILAPLATELPEKVNSFFWVREGKDSLALGNISGAMVFQSTIPVGIGLLFTEWELSGNAALSVGLGLAGGLLAYATLHRGNRFTLPAVIAWFVLYASFIVVVLWAAPGRATLQL